ncbi:protein of unknown function [Paraburkholderia dioscoreae]|jgi:hypothetical protein|uniref:Uncharacterized protein n=1 Tax=Paraburkholderia dioscoreae TaxID=2604047 RepID=A0A5Q4YUT3_9BURK|nr:protein of unknown function [Paraburkholderia dioscoreae]
MSAIKLHPAKIYVGHPEQFLSTSVLHAFAEQPPLSSFKQFSEPPKDERCFFSFS